MMKIRRTVAFFLFLKTGADNGRTVMRAERQEHRGKGEQGRTVRAQKAAEVWRVSKE